MLSFNVVIVGSGAAGYCAAERLLHFGVKNIGILTEGRKAGTSRNAGSDKQTYYRLSQTQPDSAASAAEALFSGGGMHGDTALIEAARSLRCFLRLAEMGVPFPRDVWGRYADYRTDGDTAKRGASAGPYTSEFMTEELERRVLGSRDVTLIDNSLLVKIATDGQKAVGLVALQKKGSGAMLLPVTAGCIIAATGGPAEVYSNTVYPLSQTGALGVLADAGCILRNITEWQYGLASVKVRWNVSGSYQQVIPTYFSLTPENEKIEFLPESFDSEATAYDIVFKKGYHWPFDSAKLKGTSKIDIAVHEQRLQGRRVFLDFRKDPVNFDFTALSAEAKDYLSAAGAFGKTPFERLMRLNPKAAAYYKSRGIDLSLEPLEIAVCAQSCLGGAAVDVHWETNIKNLFVIGEAAGTFGLYRPGGTALNDTQVSAECAAEHIALKSDIAVPTADNDAVKAAVREEEAYLEQCMKTDTPRLSFRSRADRYAGAFRNPEEIERLCGDIEKQCAKKYFCLSSGNSFKEAAALYKYRDALNAQRLIFGTMLETLPKTGSRGGAICNIGGRVVPENKKYRSFCVNTDNTGVYFSPLRKIPDEEKSFEAVWREYDDRLAGKHFGVK